MKVILPFILNGQTLEKGMNFPKSVVSGSKDTIIVKVEGIPKGQSAVAYFSLSWENDKTYNLLFNGDECVIDEYITTLPKNTNDFIEYFVTMSVALFGDAGKRLTTKPVKLVLHKSNYSATADNTPEIPQSQFDAIVEIFNEKVSELNGGDISLSKEEANYELLKGYIDAGKTVIIKDDTSYLYLAAYDETYASFYSISGGSYFYVDYYSDGAVEEYQSPAFVNKEDVQHVYDANSDKPISGQGVAEALANVGGGGSKPMRLIASGTTTEEVKTILINKDNEGKDFEICDNVEVYISTPAVEKNGSLFVGFTQSVGAGEYITFLTNGINTTARFTAFHLWYNGGWWDGFGRYSAGDAYSSSVGYLFNGRKFAKNRKTSTIAIGGGVNFPIGTTYEIYGRDA